MAGKRGAKIVDMPGGGGGEGTSDSGRYSENPEFLGRAFSLYCKGLSLTKVAEMLRPEWPEVAPRTLQRISKEHGWEASRAGYLVLMEKAMAGSAQLLPESILNLQKMRTWLEARGPAIKFMEIKEYRALVDDLLWLTGQHPKAKELAALAVSTEAEVQAFLEATQEDEQVGPLWRKRRAHIEKRYKDKLATLDKAPKGRGKK